MGSISLRAARALLVNGERVEAGVVFRVSPLVAADVLDGGRAVLVDADDQAEVTAARIAQVTKALAQARAGDQQDRLRGQFGGGPWRAVG
jgi:hypothetical protein